MARRKKRPPSGIKIKAAHRGLFTAKARAAGRSVQAHAAHVLAHPDQYPSTTVRQANFARNAKKWG